MTGPGAGRTRGAEMEELAATALAGAGWRIVGRNVRSGRGELDIVAVDWGPPAVLAIVEVRYRSSREFGLPEETLTAAKRAALRRSIGRLIEVGALPDGTPLPRLPIRLDLICLEQAAGSGAPTWRHHRGIGLGA
jgi:Holliday junction resolvase-like predicted endonuclease